MKTIIINLLVIFSLVLSSFGSFGVFAQSATIDQAGNVYIQADENVWGITIQVPGATNIRVIQEFEGGIEFFNPANGRCVAAWVYNPIDTSKAVFKVEGSNLDIENAWVQINENPNCSLNKITTQATNKKTMKVINKQVTIPNSLNFHCQVFDMQGQPVFNKVSDSDTIQLPEMKTGIYIIRAKTKNGQIYSGKFFL